MYQNPSTLIQLSLYESYGRQEMNYNILFFIVIYLNLVLNKTLSFPKTCAISRNYVGMNMDQNDWTHIVHRYFSFHSRHYTAYVMFL